MRIGNLLSIFQQMPSTHIVILVPLPEILINIRNVPQRLEDELQQRNRDMLNKVLLQALHPHTIRQNPMT